MDAQARRSQGSSMIAQRMLDRQRAGEISARATKSPNWQRRKSDAFGYAESLDTGAEQQAGAVREAGKRLRQQRPIEPCTAHQTISRWSEERPAGGYGV